MNALTRLAQSIRAVLAQRQAEPASPQHIELPDLKRQMDQANRAGLFIDMRNVAVEPARSLNRCPHCDAMFGIGETRHSADCPARAEY